MAETERKNYEQRAEVILKKLLSRLYALETRTLEARMNSRQNIDKLDAELEKLGKQRKELETKYYDLIHASESQWRNLSNEFEVLVNRLDAENQDFNERAQSWLNEVNEKISDLEEIARNSGQELRDNTREQLEHLRDQRERLQKYLVDMRRESGERWQQISERVDEGLHSLTSGVNKLYQKFQQRRKEYATHRFYEKAQIWLNDFNDKIADLEEKTQNSTEEVRATVEEQLKDLRDQRDQIQQYLEDIRKESGERWEKIKSEIDERTGKLKGDINKVYQLFQGSGKEQTQPGTTESDTAEN